jgi:2-keto-4-pentenoate hydratase/2-oxohepta-3-ene-1,7-dioic acid hydratase in catechol pathway
MKVLRYHVNDQAFWAVVGDDPSVAHPAVITPTHEVSVDKRDEMKIASLKLLPPTFPSKIVAIGRNYLDHIQEFDNIVPGEPMFFLKPPSAVVGPGDPIVYPRISERVDYEGELAVVIGRQARNVGEHDWERYVFGYTIMNDVTARDLQKKDGQWSRAKGFDTFAPIGPWIETELDPADLAIATRLNGQVKQSSRTSRMIFSVGRQLAFISQAMTLLPGDVISTGTPAGVGAMKVGDTVEVEIEGIGVLRNTVVAG